MSIITNGDPGMIISLKRLLITCIVGLTGCMSVITAQIVRDKQRDQQVLHGISQRTGIQANWNAVQKYVICDIFVEGKTRQQINQELSEIGEFTSTGDIFDKSPEIIFTDKYIYRNLPSFGLAYDDKWELDHLRALEMRPDYKGECGKTE
jgi:hypothetical protein